MRVVYVSPEKYKEMYEELQYARRYTTSGGIIANSPSEMRIWDANLGEYVCYRVRAKPKNKLEKVLK